MLTVLERYQVLGTIGKGGMGIVFKGFHLSLERHVAIKTLRVDKITTPELVSRFRQEIKLVGQMDHAHVVRATDAGEKNGVFYLVMEFLAGRDLDKLVARNGPLRCADACELVRQAALGLEYIHQRLIHRDIKPSNLMLTSTGLVKILDLGLAHCEPDGSGDHEETPAGYTLGTRAYMAPEQAVGSRALDRRADIYGLGCTLFKLLTGNTPYSGEEYNSASKQIYAHCHVPLSAAPSFELIPEEIRPILLQMVAKNPEERFRSGAEAAAALAPFAEGNELTSLLAKAGIADPVHPLPSPLPEELSRLTEPIIETSPASATAPTVAFGPPRRKRGWLLATCVLVGILGVLSWFVAPALFVVAPVHKLATDRTPTAVRNLDDLAARQYHPLLDQKPFMLDGALTNPGLARWDQGAQLLQVTGARKQFFFLGRTSRSHFTFEVAINQAPWTGNIGLFWGYHEDEKIRKDESYKNTGSPGPYFAWFQMIKVHRSGGAINERSLYITREQGRLRWNTQDQLALDQDGTAWPPHPVAMKSGDTILQVEIEGNRLRSAHLGAIDLTAIYSPSESERCQGTVGLLSITHAGTFKNARFIALSDN